jgi:RNA polymerase sigma-70 factor (ECF subfamily)
MSLWPLTFPAAISSYVIYIGSSALKAGWMEDVTHEERAQSLKEQLVALIPKMKIHALALTRSKQTAEDLVQSTHVRVLETLHQWTGRGRFESWVVKVMNSVWSNELRHRRRRPEVELPEPDLVAAAGFEDKLQAKLVLDVLRAQSAVPDEDFDLMIKAIVYGYTITELTVELGSPRGTLLSRVARIKQALKKAARERNQEDDR